MDTFPLYGGLTVLFFLIIKIHNYYGFWHIFCVINIQYIEVYLWTQNFAFYWFCCLRVSPNTWFAFFSSFNFKNFLKLLWLGSSDWGRSMWRHRKQQLTRPWLQHASIFRIWGAVYAPLFNSKHCTEQVCHRFWHDEKNLVNTHLTRQSVLVVWIS